jgi:hypothetical protein
MFWVDTLLGRARLRHSTAIIYYLGTECQVLFLPILHFSANTEVTIAMGAFNAIVKVELKSISNHSANLRLGIAPIRRDLS